MWILPSRSRPHNIVRFLAAAKDTGMDTQVYLRLDKSDPKLDEYLKLEFPLTWNVDVGDRQPLGELFNSIYVANPGLLWYGFLADDVVPETPLWDQVLIQAAANDGLAFGYDGKHAETFATHFVLGRDLVKEFGHLALPGLHRIYIDTVWNDIAKDKGVRRYLPEVRLIHYHFSNGLAERDPIYRKPHNSEDRATYTKWRREQYARHK